MLQRGFLLFGLLLTVAFLLVGQTTTTDTRTEHSDYVQMFQFSADSKTVVSYTTDGTLLSWDLESRKLLRLQQAKAERATFDPHGKLLSIVGDARGIRLFDVVANQEVRFLEGADFTSLSDFAFTPDGKTLAFTKGVHGYVVKLWDVTTGKEKVSIERPNPDDFLEILLFSPDGETLAGLSHSLTLWSASTGKQSRSIEIRGGLARLAFTPNGKMICVSGFPSFIKCFGVLSGREVLSVQADATLPFAFSPDGSVLALSRYGQGIFLINMATGREIAKLTISVDDNSFTQMSFSPNGKLLAIASTKGLVLLDPVARKELFILAQPLDGPRGSEH